MHTHTLTRARTLDIEVQKRYLVLIDFTVLQLGFSLLLKRDDNQSDEDVDEEKWKHDKVNDVEYRHLDPVVRDRAAIFLSGRHRMLQHSATKENN